MLKNYLLTAIRFISGNKVEYFVSIAGLAVGISCVLIMFLYARFETSYDDFHTKKDRIYRLLRKSRAADNQIKYTSNVGYKIGDELKNSFTNLIKHTVRYSASKAIITSGRNNFHEVVHYADPEVFSVFDFPFSFGNPDTFGRNPNSVVITASTAKKYFGKQNPIGESLIFTVPKSGERKSLTITAVLEDLPKNSIFKFNLLVSYKLKPNVTDRIKKYWGYHSKTFLELNEGYNQKALERKLIEFVNRLPIDERYVKNMLIAEPLKDLHLFSQAASQYVYPGSVWFNIFLIFVLGLMVLICASINVVGILTAMSGKRAKEIGIRKVLGATRTQLRIQYLLESILLNIIALPISLIAVQFLLPHFNSIMNCDLRFDYGKNLELFGFTVLFAIMLGIISGIYPSVVLSNLKPIKNLKQSRSKKGKIIQWIFLFMQLTIFITLLLSTLLVHKENQELKFFDPGYQTDNLFLTNINGQSEIIEKMRIFKNELTRVPGVLDVTASKFVPMLGKYDQSIKVKNKILFVDGITADKDYFRTLNIPIIEGTDFSDETSPYRLIIINQKMKRTYHYGVGDIIDSHPPLKVIGIVKDFHSTPVYELKPMILYNNLKDCDFIVFKIAPENRKKTIKKVQEIWKSVFPNQPFDVQPFQEKLDEFLEPSSVFYSIMKMVSGVALLISCFGLLSVVTFRMRHRKKETAIRKILGASVKQLVYLHYKEYIVITVLSYVTGCALSYYAINLVFGYMRYAYTIKFSVGILIFSFIFSLTFTAIIVGYHIFKAVFDDPVNVIRYE